MTLCMVATFTFDDGTSQDVDGVSEGGNIRFPLPAGGKSVVGIQINSIKGSDPGRTKKP